MFEKNNKIIGAPVELDRSCTLKSLFTVHSAHGNAEANML
jgi:hypothetical protein